MRLSGGGLMIYSPVKADETLFAAIDSLGPVQHIIAPNPIHHLYVEQWASRYPLARLVAAPGLQERKPHIKFHKVLQHGTEELDDAAWRDDCRHAVIVGHRWYSEIIFFHRPSKTLVLADAIENMGFPESPWKVRLFTRLMGMWRAPSCVSDLKITWWGWPKDKAQAAVTRILSFDFNRIVMAHGRIITPEVDAKQVFRDAWAFCFTRD